MGGFVRAQRRLLRNVVLTLAAMQSLSCALAATAAPIQVSISHPRPGKIGVAYGLNGDNLLSPKQAVALLCSKGIRRVRTYEARSDVTEAFANTGIDLILGVPNVDIPKIAASVEGALSWVIDNVIPFPSSGISAIIVGNEWLMDPSHDPALLLPAMENMYMALSASRIFLPFTRDIKVSTCHAFNVLASSYPPSAGAFDRNITSVMAPLVKFLVETRSFFMVNIFPYFAYLKDEGVSLEFVLFESTESVQDPNTGLNYTNLFDMQIDAAYAAVELLMASPSTSSPPCRTDTGKGNPYAHINGEGDQYGDVKAATPRRSSDRKPSVPLRVGESGYSSGHGATGSTPRMRVSPMDDLWLSRKAPLSPSRKAQPFQESLNVMDAPQAMSSPKSLSKQPSSTSPSDEEPSVTSITTKRCECEADTVQNAETYNQNLIRHVLHAHGTPGYPNTPIQAYIFALFNEDLKADGAEQHFGLFYPNGTAVYPIDFHPL